MPKQRNRRTETAMIEVNGLTRLYKNNRGIKNLSFKLEDGDKIVITGGVTNGKSGNTNLIKVETV